MSILAITGASFRRLARDRTALFFMLILPVMIILVIGTVVGEQTAFRLGIPEIHGQEATAASTAIAALDNAPAIDVQRVDDEASGVVALRRGELDAILTFPAGMDEAIDRSEPVEIALLADQANATQRAAAAAVRTVLFDMAGELQAARVRQSHAGGTLDENRAAVDELVSGFDAVRVEVRTVDSESGYLPLGFGYSAPTMLVLFVFVTSLAGGAAMIESRRLGIHARLLAAPVTPRRIVAGEALSYLAVALLQSAIIVSIGAFVFGVEWGDPLAAAALVGTWALVGAGAGMLAGTLFRTSEQASAIGSTAGIVAGMLGGCMWPLEIVGPVMRTIGHLVPHAWAIDGWVDVLSRGGGVADVAVELVVLAGFAAALLAVASFRLEHRLTA